VGTITREVTLSLFDEYEKIQEEEGFKCFLLSHVLYLANKYNISEEMIKNHIKNYLIMRYIGF
jgi:hypothetical protein